MDMLCINITVNKQQVGIDPSLVLCCIDPWVVWWCHILQV